MLAHSENASERRHSRNNRGACYGGINDSKVSKVVTTWNNRRQHQAAGIHALAASILAEGSESDDKDDDDEEFPDLYEQRTGG